MNGWILYKNDVSESWEKIAERLNVKYVLTSSLYKDDNQFKLSSQLINTDTGISEYANKWVEPNEKSANIVNKLAKQVLEIISPDVDTPITNQEKIIDSESYALYLKAKSYAGPDQKYRNVTTEELNLARKLLEKSIILLKIIIKLLMPFLKFLIIKKTIKVHMHNINWVYVI